MTARFIVRLLTADGDLLGWTEVQAEAKPQGRPRSTPFKASTPSVFLVERDGVATQLSIHWADLDVARLTPLMEPSSVLAGQVVQFHWIEPVWMVEGSKVEVPLPPVTVRAPVTIAPPTGGLTALA